MAIEKDCIHGGVASETCLDPRRLLCPRRIAQCRLHRGRKGGAPTIESQISHPCRTFHPGWVSTRPAVNVSHANSQLVPGLLQLPASYLTCSASCTLCQLTGKSWGRTISVGCVGSIHDLRSEWYGVVTAYSLSTSQKIVGRQIVVHAKATNRVADGLLWCFCKKESCISRAGKQYAGQRIRARHLYVTLTRAFKQRLASCSLITHARRRKIVTFDGDWGREVISHASSGWVSSIW